jgi:hypothetical protein
MPAIHIASAAERPDTRHECPCCRRNLPAPLFMCSGCERAVPKRTRDAMAAAVERDDREAWTVLRSQAVTEVTAKLAARKAAA